MGKDLRFVGNVMVPDIEVNNKFDFVFFIRFIKTPECFVLDFIKNPQLNSFPF